MKRVILVVISIILVLMANTNDEMVLSDIVEVVDSFLGNETITVDEPLVNQDDAEIPDDIEAYAKAIVESDTVADYIELNDNVPYFLNGDESVLTSFPLEQYEPLDELGRVTEALASVSEETMPTEDRESISSVYPTGWEQEKYDHVNGTYLYNRSHMIGFQLTGENANALNLMTGTRQFNVEGMLPFEDMVADYVHETNQTVLYRVTPIFYEDELLARGVVLEAYSYEDQGFLQFNVFIPNVQDGVQLDYASGHSELKSGY